VLRPRELTQRPPRLSSRRYAGAPWRVESGEAHGLASSGELPSGSHLARAACAHRATGLTPSTRRKLEDALACASPWAAGRRRGAEQIDASGEPPLRPIHQSSQSSGASSARALMRALSSARGSTCRGSRRFRRRQHCADLPCAAACRSGQRRSVWARGENPGASQGVRRSLPAMCSRRPSCHSSAAALASSRGMLSSACNPGNAPLYRNES